MAHTRARNTPRLSLSRQPTFVDKDEDFLDAEVAQEAALDDGINHAADRRPLRWHDRVAALRVARSRSQGPRTQVSGCKQGLVCCVN